MKFERAKARLARWKADPVAFVRENFGVEPDAWQADGLRAFPKANRMAFKSAKGPGKSCLLAWLIWCFLSTRPYEPRQRDLGLFGAVLAA